MNILIKLTCLVGLVIAPILGEIYGDGHAAANIDEQVKTEIIIQQEISEEK